MSKSALEDKQQDIRYRDRIIVALFFLLVLMVFAYLRFPSNIDIHRIPDPGRLLSHNIVDIPKTHVNAFARLTIETIMHCEEDCEDDIPENIDALRAYITDDCRSQMKTHVELNPNLFDGRTRQIEFVYDKTPSENPFAGDSPLGKVDKDVIKIDDHTWHVSLDYQLSESVSGYNTINTEVNYPVRIIKSTLPKVVNEYQLQFDCFYAHIERNIKKEKKSESN